MPTKTTHHEPQAIGPLPVIDPRRVRGIDYETLLNELLRRRRISKKKFRKYQEDEDALPNDVGDGEQVLALGWDGNAPGCSGAIWVSRWKGFYFTHSSDYDPEGPFESLEDVLNMDCFSTETSRPELRSDSVSLRKLLKIACRLVGEDGDEIFVNGRCYVMREGKLVKSDLD